MKTPTFLNKLAAVITGRSKHKLRAATRAVPQTAMDSYDNEPTTRLSSAFIVVLVLHVVAVGGIYAFNSIKASRRGHDPQPVPLAEPPKAPVPATVRNPAPAASSAVAARPAEKAAATAATPGPAQPRPAPLKQHQVRPGDTATKIAGQYGLKTDELLAANDLTDTAVLRPGKMLTIPAPRAATKAVTPDAQKPAAPKPVNVAPTRTTPGVYVVRKGDTATSIAKMYGLTAAELLTLNKISDARKLREGQPLTIPKKKG